MGKGNVCVNGKFEGLYYVDRDYIDCYISNDMNNDGEYENKMLGDMSMEDFQNYEYDSVLSEMYYNDFIQEFTSMMKNKFKSFVSTGNDYGAVLENNLFEVVIEDNEWSYAVMLIQKECWYDNHLEGLQKKHCLTYLDGMKTVLLELFPTIGCYCGAWTHGTIKREDVFNN